jgi:hypothetical protein
MPRKSSAALSVVTPLVEAGRVRPRRELPENVASAFREIVATVPAEHFKTSDMPLIEQYAFAIVLGRESFKHLSEEGQVVAGRTSPWVTCFEKSQRVVTALCMRLRLAPQARIRPETVGRRQGGGMTADAYLSMMETDE